MAGSTSTRKQTEREREGGREREREIEKEGREIGPERDARNGCPMQKALYNRIPYVYQQVGSGHGLSPLPGGTQACTRQTLAQVQGLHESALQLRMIMPYGDRDLTAVWSTVATLASADTNSLLATVQAVCILYGNNHAGTTEQSPRRFKSDRPVGRPWRRSCNARTRPP